MATTSAASFAGNFNPRSPHGERPQSVRCSLRATNFNPRSPHGERPFRHRVRATQHLISIHAPRTGSDVCHVVRQPAAQYFNPRSPHGERQHDAQGGVSASAFQSTLPARGATQSVDQYTIHKPFQSTLPARGATNPGVQRPPGGCISIHAPRTGSDTTRAA
mgnify:CR=1 FL=1